MSVLRVDLQDQRHLARVVGVVLGRQADLAGDRRVAGLGGEVELVLGVLRGRVGEEVARAVLDSLVDRQEQQRAVAGAELEQQAAKAGALARREGRQKGLLLGRGLDLHWRRSLPRCGIRLDPTRIIPAASVLDHNFTGPPFTIGIEEELMILDADGLGLAQEIEAILDAVPDELEGQVKPELIQSVLEIATTPCDGVARRRRGAPRPCGAPWPRSPSDEGCCWRRVRHAPVRALGGPGDRRPPALPRAGRGARLHRPPGADLRHPRPRRDRGRRPGDLRRRRHPPLPAAAPRPVGQLAVLARASRPG